MRSRGQVKGLQEFVLSTSFTGTWFFVLSPGEAGEGEVGFGYSAIRRFSCSHLLVPRSCAGKTVPVLWWTRPGQRSKWERTLQSLFSHISWLMWQGPGQEGAAASPGGERAGTACQGFLHCPGDGAVGTCPVLALQLGYLLPFLLKATGHCSLIHLFRKACLLFSFLQVTMILVKTISQNFPLWKLEFSKC